MVPTDSTAYISLGSNLGDARANLATALRAVNALPGLQVAAASSCYMTEPQGLRDQPFFVNQTARLFCTATVSPLRLLEMLLGLETALGRVRGSSPRFGPRVIDLDLLLFGNEVMNTKRLLLPHPRMLERAFVLVPLLEIAPDLRLPDGTALQAALAGLAYERDGYMLLQNG